MSCTNELIKGRIDEYEDKTFLVSYNREYSYTELGTEIECWINKFNTLNIRQGDVVSVIGEYSPEIAFLIFALLVNKNIIVPVAMEKGIASIEKYHRIAKVQYSFIWNKKNGGFDLKKVNMEGTHELLEQLRRENEAGIIIFTSGSTGESKAAVHQFSRIVSRYAENQKSKPYRTLVFLKIDHIGGLNTLFSLFFYGGSIIMSVNSTPESICETISKYQVELLPTTPSFLNMLIISGAYKRFDISSLKLITYGTEPMPQNTLNSIHSIFPDVKVKQTYGLTELGILSTQSRSSDSPWLRIGGNDTAVKIVDNILYIKTDSAMLGYLNAENEFTEDGWYNTGDYVEIDGDYIKILGRNAEIINIGGEKVYPGEIENILLQMDNVNEVIVEGKANPIMGQIIHATFQLKEKEDSNAFQKRVIEYCRDKMDAYKIPRIIRVSDKSLIGERMKKYRSFSQLNNIKLKE